MKKIVIKFMILCLMATTATPFVQANDALGAKLEEFIACEHQMLAQYGTKMLSFKDNAVAFLASPAGRLLLCTAAVGAIPGAIIGHYVGKSRAESANKNASAIYNRWHVFPPNVKDNPFSNKQLYSTYITQALNEYAGIQDVTDELGRIYTLLQKVSTDDPIHEKTKAYCDALEALDNYIKTNKQDLVGNDTCIDSKKRIKSYTRWYSALGAITGAVAACSAVVYVATKK